MKMLREGDVSSFGGGGMVDVFLNGVQGRRKNKRKKNFFGTV
jgi:hypothetical protein